MAKGLYQDWLTEEKLILLRGWARNGLTDEQIAHNMGIATGTLYEWKKKYTEINEALKESKEIADIAVENALYLKALNGDTTAMIFWLKNRKSKDWREKQDINANVDSTINIVVDIDDNV
jgi:hypothetical protein